MVRGEPGNQEGTPGIKTSYNRTRTIIMEPIPPSRIGNVRGSGIPPSRPRCMTTWPPQQKRGLFHGASRGAQVVEVTLLTAMTWAAEPVFPSSTFAFALRAVDRPFGCHPRRRRRASNARRSARRQRAFAPAVTPLNLSAICSSARRPYALRARDTYPASKMSSQGVLLLLRLLTAHSTWQHLQTLEDKERSPMRLSHAAVVLTSNPEGMDMKLLMTRKHYLEVANKWWSKYRGMKPQAVPS